MNPLSIHCNRPEHLIERLIKLGFSRGEFYNFLPEQLPVLKQFILDEGIIPSVHCPLRKAPWYPHPVTWSYLSTDVHYEERELSFRLVEESLRDSQDIGATYMVVHYPTPASPEAHRISPEEQYEIAWSSARRLHELAGAYGVPIHIEGFGPSPFLTADFLRRVVSAYPNLRYCFDTGHMLLAAQRDGLDYFGFLEDMAPYLGCVHVWNTRGMDDYRAYHHLPPHPGLRPDEGWVDMERVVETVCRVNPEVVFVLEYSGAMPAEFGLDHAEGVEWFKRLVTSSTCGAADAGPRSRRNIVLTGFMATGKTSAGRAVAARLGRAFVDMDEMLADRLGMSIPDVFRLKGETFFREQEAALCQELAGQKELVIATGGGALVRPENRQALAGTGLLICLQCEPSEVLRRVGSAQDRPMLHSPDLKGRVEGLLAQRQPAYAAISHRIDTTHLTVEQVTEDILALWRNGDN